MKFEKLNDSELDIDTRCFVNVKVCGDVTQVKYIEKINNKCWIKKLSDIGAHCKKRKGLCYIMRNVDIFSLESLDYELHTFCYFLKLLQQDFANHGFNNDNSNLFDFCIGEIDNINTNFNDLINIKG